MISIFDTDETLGVLRGRRYSQSEIKGLLARAGWPADLIETMSAIVMAESSGYAEAHNPSGEDSWGLAQVNRVAWPQYSVEQLKDPRTNLEIAYRIYQRQGFNAWGAYTHPRGNPRYRQFLNRGGAAVTPPDSDGSPAANITPGGSSGVYYVLGLLLVVLLIRD